MKVVIYGKPNCPWCDRAKELVKTKPGIECEYIDITVAGINGPKLSELCGVTVSTVPQIFINGVYNPGGFQGLVPKVNAFEAPAVAE